MWIPSRSSALAAWLALAVCASAPRARADEDAMAPFRERFKSGMKRYEAGDVASALRFWEPIYTELGPSRGYRLSFDLARAYETFGDATRAAERYESFLAEVSARRSSGATLEPLVVKEEGEARERLAQLVATRSRLVVTAGRRPVSVQIDELEPRLAPFLMYVPPGRHVITFAPGAADAERRDVTTAAGEELKLEPAPPKDEPAAPVARAAPAPPPAPPPRLVHEVSRPFSPVVLYAAGAVTAASATACVALYVRALSLKSDHDAASTDSVRASTKADYDALRPTAYASLGIAVGVAALTGALGTWYFAGTTSRDVAVSVAVLPLPGGALGGLRARF